MSDERVFVQSFCVHVVATGPAAAKRRLDRIRVMLEQEAHVVDVVPVGDAPEEIE